MADSPEPITILVVDDEPLMQRFLCHALSVDGYSLLKGHSARHALELCRQHLGSIDLLVTDICMPGMDGLELAAQARTLRPHMRILFVSGSFPVTKSVPVEFGGFLPKPFSPDILRHKVRELLA